MLLKASKVLFICFWQVQKYMQINICVFSLPRRKWYDDKHEKKEIKTQETTTYFGDFEVAETLAGWFRYELRENMQFLKQQYDIVYRSGWFRFIYILANCWETCDISDVRTPSARVNAPHAPHTPPSPFLSYPLYKCRVNAHVTN